MALSSAPVLAQVTPATSSEALAAEEASTSAAAATPGRTPATAVDAPAEVVPAVPTTTKAPPDSVPPTINDLAIASDNPAVAPIITVSIRDAGGIDSATVHFRVKGGAWKAVPLVGGTTAMRIARLPDGTQKDGFDFFVEVKDTSGNVSTSGSKNEPLAVPPAAEGNIARVEGADRDASAIAGPHPGWVMLAMGTGVLAGAGAAIFGYDLGIVQARSETVKEQLAGNVSAARRKELEANQKQLQDAITQDTAVTAILGVIGGAALATGITLLVVGAVEQ